MTCRCTHLRAFAHAGPAARTPPPRPHLSCKCSLRRSRPQEVPSASPSAPSSEGIPQVAHLSPRGDLSISLPDVQVAGPSLCRRAPYDDGQVREQVWGQLPEEGQHHQWGGLVQLHRRCAGLTVRGVDGARGRRGRGLGRGGTWGGAGRGCGLDGAGPRRGGASCGGGAWAGRSPWEPRGEARGPGRGPGRGGAQLAWGRARLGGQGWTGAGEGESSCVLEGPDFLLPFLRFT